MFETWNTDEEEEVVVRENGDEERGKKVKNS